MADSDFSAIVVVFVVVNMVVGIRSDDDDVSDFLISPSRWGEKKSRKRVEDLRIGSTEHLKRYFSTLSASDFTGK